MKTVYPAPLAKGGMHQYILQLESRLAHRTRGTSHFTRALRARSKLLVVRVLDKIERICY